MDKKIKGHQHDDDAPLTAAELKRLRPARKAAPAIVAAYEAGALRYRGQRGVQKAPTKTQVTLRLDSEIVDAFRSTGSGWQTRVNDLLKAVVGASHLF